jgi:hypothetical protein
MRAAGALLAVWFLGAGALASAHGGPMADSATAESLPPWAAADAGLARPLTPSPQGSVHGGVAPATGPVLAPTRVAGPQGTRDFEFVCPNPRPGAAPNPPEDPVILGCPLRFRDTGNSLVNSAVAVDPADASRIAIASLHGTAVPDGPRDYSRRTQTHTTHVSLDGGATWADHFLDSGNQPSSAALGADVDLAMDSLGQIYLAFLFDKPSVGGGMVSVLHLHTGRLDELDSYSGYDFPWTPAPRAPSSIRLAHLAHVPAWGGLGDGNAGQPLEGPDGRQGQANHTLAATPERVVAVWHESVLDPRDASLTQWLDAAWTGPRSGQAWQGLGADHRIGPCSDGSNPVAWRGKAYVACVVAAGYSHRQGARPGDVDLWSIDPATGQTTPVGFTGVRGGGRPFLSLLETAEGSLLGVLAYTKVTEGAKVVRLETRGGYAWMTRDGSEAAWTPMARSTGSQLRGLGGAVTLRDADITAFELVDASGAYLVVYKEWHDAPQTVEPDDPALLIGNVLMEYNKFLVAFDPCDALLAGYHVQLGSGVDAFNAEQRQHHPATFNSVKDGLWRVPTPGGFLVYFSIDDYGSMQFGGLRGDAAAAGGCFVTPPPLSLPAVAVPQGVAATSSAGTWIGAGLGLVSLLMVGYLLAARRPSTSGLASKAKRR